MICKKIRRVGLILVLLTQEMAIVAFVPATATVPLRPAKSAGAAAVLSGNTAYSQKHPGN